MAFRYNLNIDQGSLFEALISLDVGEEFTLADFEFRAQFAKHHEAKFKYDFNVELLNDNEILLSLPTDRSSGIPAGNYEYDIYMFDTFSIIPPIRIMEGSLKLRPQITRG